MFENKTFESILGDMLDYVSNRNPELDINVGSIIYTALAPIALELETAYHEMDMILGETFLDTASMEYLIKHGNQLGVELIEATNGHYLGEFDVDVPIGSRFNLDKFNYNVIEKLSEPDEDHQYYRFEMVCETAGTEPNGRTGDLTPITFIDKLGHARIISTMIYGEDEEDAESYRYRIQVHAQNPALDGNVAQYNEWLNEYSGIGKYKVTPCWNGVNTVKLTVLSSENTAANEELISDVQDYFDPPTSTINDNISDSTYPQGRGMGNGQAPIGSIITVDTVTQVPVVVRCQLKLKTGYTSTVEVKDAIYEYLNSTALEKNTVDYMVLSAVIYNVASVGDVVRLAVTVKGTTMDANASEFVRSVTLGDNEIAVLDTENSFCTTTDMKTRIVSATIQMMYDGNNHEPTTTSISMLDDGKWYKADGEVEVAVCDRSGTPYYKAKAIPYVMYNETASTYLYQWEITEILECGDGVAVGDVLDTTPAHTSVSIEDATYM